MSDQGGTREPVKVRAKVTDSHAARRKFFARPLTAEYAHELAELLAEVPEEIGAEAKTTYLTFRLGGSRLALPVAVVQAVSPSVAICRLPQYGDTACLGLVAVDGQIMPCLSLHRLMNLPALSERSAKERVVVLEDRPGELWAFVADEVIGVITGSSRGATNVGELSGLSDVWQESTLHADGDSVALVRTHTLFRAMAGAVA